MGRSRARGSSSGETPRLSATGAKGTQSSSSSPEARTMDTATISPTKVGSSLSEVRNPSLAPERKVSNTGTPLT